MPRPGGDPNRKGFVGVYGKGRLRTRDAHRHHVVRPGQFHCRTCRAGGRACVRGRVEVNAYALVVARGGVRLKASEPGVCAPPQPECFGPAALIGRIMAPHVLMSEIAAALSQIMDRPVVDRTGQVERFAGLRLEWVPDDSQYTAWGPGVWARPVSDPKGPALATALQEQLGLRLESTKAPITVTVIESAARPTEN